MSRHLPADDRRAREHEPEPFGREEGRFVFGTAARMYALVRPGYPLRVFEVLGLRCGLGPSTRVLEIGAGTGQATVSLLASGAFVVAVEPDRALVEELKNTAGGDGPRLEIVTEPFEDTALPADGFDLVVSATAFHWIEPESGLSNVARVLRPAGWCALWWNVFGDPRAPDAFHDATDRLLRGVVPGPGGDPYALDVDRRIADLHEHGFVDIEHEIVPWSLTLDAARVRQLYSTFSPIARLPEAVRTQLLDQLERVAAEDFGDRVERRMLTPLYTARLA